MDEITMLDLFLLEFECEDKLKRTILLILDWFYHYPPTKAEIKRIVEQIEDSENLNIFDYINKLRHSFVSV